jgi:ubiquinone/menaquinone biosynthesis C-methylase UbiE
MIRDLDERASAAIADLFRERLFPGCSGPAIEHETYVHLTHRLRTARDQLVPWLAQFIDMGAARVLEVGAGTGSSVVAFAEASAHVDALDILDTHLDVARARVAAHGFENVSIYCRNATDDLAEITSAPYDLIVFAAALEHMIYEERIAALRMAWRYLAPTGVLAIYETPNRLWFFDGHTSLANFINWLPDQLAIDYASRTPRDGFNAGQLTGETLYRWGRGASFHEIEIAIGLSNIDILQSMHEYLAQKFDWYLNKTERPIDQRYRALLAEIEPGLPAPFTEETLNLALRRRG